MSFLEKEVTCTVPFLNKVPWQTCIQSFPSSSEGQNIATFTTSIS